MKFLENLDLFKKQINLQSIDSEKYSTKLGLILSILLYAVTIYLVVYYFKKITDKELQSIVISNRVMTESPHITFTSFVPYIARFEDINSKPYYYESVMKLNGYYYKCKKSNFICDSFELNLTKCKLNTFPHKYENILQVNKLGDAYCINFEDNPNLNGSLTLSGSWSEDHLNYLSIFGRLCFNKSSCLNSDDLNNYLYSNPLYLSFYSLEDNLNPQNYSVPVFNNVKLNYLQVVNNMYKTFNNYLTMSNISSDIGLVNEQINYTQIYSNEIILQDINYYSVIDTTQALMFGQFNIYSNNMIYFVNRYYMRLQSLISFVLTILNTLIIIMKFVKKDVVIVYSTVKQNIEYVLG